MPIDPNIVSAAGQALPSLVSLIARLVELGFSHNEAAEIVKRDIESRVGVYERMKAEDREALKLKHGIVG